MLTSDTFKSDVALLLFNNTNIANIGDATGVRGSTVVGSWHISLHTADPGAAGSQTTSEATYTGYARVAVARSTAGFTVATGSVTNAAAVTFPAATAGTNVIPFFGVGTDASGVGNLKYRGVLGTNIGPFVAESTDNVFTVKNHGLAVNDKVLFYAPTGAALPAGSTAGTTYYVITAPSVDTITVSATEGGAALDITTDGDGILFKSVPLSVSSGITPSFAIGQLTIATV